jgi:hypothetical protein
VVKRLSKLPTALVVAALTSIYIATTEAGGRAIVDAVAQSGTDAPNGEERFIFVLTGDTLRIGPAVDLQRRTGLPILVVGKKPELQLAMLVEHGGRGAILEDRSRDTEENALFVACLLPQHEAAFLVTDEVHMRRARAWFAFYGIRPTSYPAPFTVDEPARLRWVPSGSGYVHTRAALHEAGGLVEVALRRATGSARKCPAKLHRKA